MKINMEIRESNKDRREFGRFMAIGDVKYDIPVKHDIPKKYRSAIAGLEIL